MHIGIFDSGIGGEAIAQTIARYFPAARITTVNDKENVPYGEKTPEQIRTLTEKALQPLLHGSCDVIVIACNSATAAAIDYLRHTYPHEKIIGLEPMVKPASELTRTGSITVCATPTTLASSSYTQLKKLYAHGIEIYEPDCSQWAYLIEHNSLNRQQIKHVVRASAKRNADVIVLGCTHYHWIKDEIEQLAGPGVTVLEPSEAVARRIAYLTSTAQR